MTAYLVNIFRAGLVAELVDAADLGSVNCRFKSCSGQPKNIRRAGALMFFIINYICSFIIRRLVATFASKPNNLP